jgi:hypothetical protein
MYTMHEKPTFGGSNELNRNISQSHLTAAATAAEMDAKEVEIRA